MKRFASLCYFLLSCLTIINAQEKRVDYNSETGLTEFMEATYFLLDYESQNLDYPPVDGNFISSDQVNFNKIPAEYWIRFTIHNNEKDRVSIQLFVGLSEVLDFYIPDEKGFQKYPIGVYESRKVVKKISGEGKTFLSQAVITLAPNETRTYYAYFKHLSSGVQAERDSRIAPRLISENIWIDNNETSTVVWSFIFGCFLILILYHFVYYFLTRESVYLYYCLFVFSVSFPFFTLVRDVADIPEFNAMLFFSISGLFAVFYFQLTRKLIDLPELLPKWDKILRYYIIGKVILVVIYSVVHLILEDIFIILAVYIPAILVENVLIFLLVIALWKTRDRIAMLFVIGSLIAFAGLFIAILSADPKTAFTPQINPFKFATPAYGFVLESLFFAGVLAYRTKLNEIERKAAKDALIRQLQENKELQEKVNKELEARVQERTKTLRIEQQKSESLLLNVLPQTIVNELKETGHTIPKRYDEVTVLFADFVGFTRISEKLDPEEIVERLDNFFRQFDAIIKRNKLEKIKTIGDAYMCVCGLPNPDPDHTLNTVMAALEIQEYMREYNKRLNEDEEPWMLRIGIHSGPVVAGVIGDYKFAYDVWGDTVNTSSRLEQASTSGKINISEALYLQVRHKFQCRKRGSIEVKNKGLISMYFVEKLRDVPLRAK